MLPPSVLRPVLNLPVWAGLLPALAGLVWQLSVAAPEISAHHPYSDVLHYERLASGERDFFGTNHMSYRLMVPLLLRAFPEELSRVAFGLVVFVGLSGALVRVRSAMGTPAVWVLLAGLYTSPAFWRGFFLPLPDALLLILLLLIAAELRSASPRAAVLAVLALAAVLTKEMALLALLFVPALARPGQQTQLAGFLIAAGLVYALLLAAGRAGPDSTYVLSPEAWAADWLRLDAHTPFQFLKALISGGAGFSVALALFYFLKTKRPDLRPATSLAAVFTICWLFAPENAPRLIFPFTGFALMLTAPPPQQP